MNRPGDSAPSGGTPDTERALLVRPAAPPIPKRPSQTLTQANDHAPDRIADGSKRTAASDVNVPGCVTWLHDYAITPHS